MRLLSAMAIVFGFALYFISIGSWQSPLLLGLSVPLIIGGATVLAILGKPSAIRIARRGQVAVHALYMAWPPDTATIESEDFIDPEAEILPVTDARLLFTGLEMADAHHKQQLVSTG